METLILENNSVHYEFRKVEVKDLNYIRDNFGFEEFQRLIGDMTNLKALSAALYRFMFQLLVKPNFKNESEFADSFGVGYRDVAKLYSQLNLCIGNSNDLVLTNSKLMEENRALKKQNNKLKWQLMVEKGRSLKRSILGAFE